MTLLWCLYGGAVVAVLLALVTGAIVLHGLFAQDPYDP